MTHDDVQRWLDRYVAAWRSYDVDEIGDLFAADAVYRYHPWDEDPVRGREAIVALACAGRQASIATSRTPGTPGTSRSPSTADRAVAIG